MMCSADIRPSIHPKQLGEIFPKQILRKDALTELPTRPKPTGRLIAED